jgi:TolB-like protein
MKKHLAILVLLFSFVSAQETIAVIEFEGLGISQIEAKALTNRLRDELVKTGKYTVIERGRMEEILKEQAFHQIGCTSDECAVEVGELLSVRQILIGSISKVGTVFSVSARIVDVESGEIVNTEIDDFKGDISDLLTLRMLVVAKKIAGLDNETFTNRSSRSTVRGGQRVPNSQRVPNILVDETETIIDERSNLDSLTFPLLFDWVLVEKAAFNMGNNMGADDAKPVHPVILSDFYITKTLITNDQYYGLLDYFESTSPSLFGSSKTTWFPDPRIPTYSLYPPKIEGSENPQLTWVLANNFCRLLGEEIGMLGRLPTEAEWEFICRSAEKGEDFDFNDSLEWVNDWYIDDIYSWVWKEDPEGRYGKVGSVFGNDWKVLRGEGCTSRNYSEADDYFKWREDKNYFFGNYFRCVTKKIEE